MEDFEKHLAQLHQEFLDHSNDRVAHLDDMLDAASAKGELEPGAQIELARIVHSLKGSGTTYGYPNLTIIAHRLEDYLAASDGSESLSLKDIRIFVDRIGDVIDGRISQDGPIDTIVRSLPMRSRFDVSDVTITEIEVDLIMEPGAQARLVTKELEACGYRVTHVQSSIQAIGYVYQTRPDCVFVSANMPGLDGVDFVRALKAMRATEEIPCALLTAFSRDNQLLQGLPESVPVIRKGKYFGDDLADALQKLGLL
ncbi:response regulator [Nisaea acidiphila]|uniref:Response regulator n=1 Tax=Nisaea acidiphila TaxID=1862145 RepID=A0A9J7AY29_9PROT|nr:response regulator [Nisaea acidiphila]UUX50333.1 response regulator [Nisaea acidiphila]